MNRQVVQVEDRVSRGEQRHIGQKDLVSVGHPTASVLSSVGPGGGDGGGERGIIEGRARSDRDEMKGVGIAAIGDENCPGGASDGGVGDIARERAKRTAIVKLLRK